MTTAQLVFSIALGIISLIIIAFTLYVANTTVWGDRWVRAPKKKKSEDE